MSELWAKRFAAMTFVNTIIAMAWMIFPLFIDQRISRTIAGGSAGTWGYLGFLLFSIVGVLGFAVFSLFYWMIPKITGGKIRDVFAWAHLVLLEIGVIGSSALFGYAGYIGGTTILEGTAKGLPLANATALVHPKIAFTIEPIGAFIGLAIIGILAGMVALFFAYRNKK